MATLEQYNKWRNVLINLMQRATDAAGKLSLREMAKNFVGQAKNLEDDTFKLQVVGTVKNGKSSFSNALLEENVLPVDTIPCTAIVSEVKYGNAKRAIVYFRNPMPNGGLLDKIPVSTREYIKKHNYGKDPEGNDIQIPPLEVSIDELYDYVAIPEPPEEILNDEEKFLQYKIEIDKYSPFDIVEIFLPANILNNRVEIVDTPGLNESPKRTEVTLNYLQRADAAIFLMNAQTPVTESEKLAIEEQIIPLGLKDLIMVANKIDLVGDPDDDERRQQRDRQRQKRYIAGQVMGYTSVKEIFTVSAYQANKGRRKGDTSLIQKSGILDFKEFLIKYLTDTKGALKLLKPARSIQGIINNELINSFIPRRRNDLTIDALKLQNRLNEALPVNLVLQSNRSKMESLLGSKIPDSIKKVNDMINSFFTRLYNDVDQWMKDFTPQTDWTFFANKEERESLAKEVAEHIGSKIEETYKDFSENVFPKVFEAESKALFSLIDVYIYQIATGITKVGNLLDGNKLNETSVEDTKKRLDEKIQMRLLPSSKEMGLNFAGVFDVNDYFKQFYTKLISALGVSLLAIYVFHPAMIIVGIIGALSRIVPHIGSANAAKEKTVKKCKSLIEENSVRLSKEFQDSVKATFETIKNSVLNSVDEEIDMTRERIASIERNTKEDAGSIESQKTQLTKICDELKDVEAGLNALISEIEEDQKAK